MSIILDKHKLIIQDKKLKVEVPWNEIYSITLDKYDLIDNKLSCLCIELEYGEFFEVFENMDIWDELISNLYQHLPINNLDLLSFIKNISSDSETMELYKKE